MMNYSVGANGETLTQKSFKEIKKLLHITETVSLPIFIYFRAAV